MTNQEVIRILDEQRNKFMDEWVDFGGVNEAYNMAIKALKEQEAVGPKSHPAKAWTRAKTLWFCGACGARISKRKTKYCQECGTVVKWT